MAINVQVIIELVDSGCRDSTDMQYMTIPKKSQIPKNSLLISLCNSVPLSLSVLNLNSTSSGTKKHCT